MCPAVTYKPCATSSRENTSDIITFKQFEEGDLLSETRNNAESGDKSDENSIIPTLLREEEMYLMDSGDESDGYTMSIEMLEYIRDRSQSHMKVNRIEARYKRCDSIKQGQSECKEALTDTQDMGKVLQKLFKTFVKEISQELLLG